MLMCCCLVPMYLVGSWFVVVWGCRSCGGIRRGPVRGWCRREVFVRGVAAVAGDLRGKRFGWLRAWHWGVSCGVVPGAVRGYRQVEFRWGCWRRSLASYQVGCWCLCCGGRIRGGGLRGGRWRRQRSMNCHLGFLVWHRGTGWGRRVLRRRGHRQRAGGVD